MLYFPFVEEVEFGDKWLRRDEFLDMIATAQSVPGVFAVNMAIFTGYRLKGCKGSVVTVLGTILPSFLIILAIAVFFVNFNT